MSGTGSDEYQEKWAKVENIYQQEDWYGSIVMDIIVLALGIYFIRIKRWQRFELSIVVCMFLKYFLYAFQTTDTYVALSDKVIIAPYIFTESLLQALGPINHWIYTSQYLKTSFLTRGIVKKAILLYHRNKTVIENEYGRTTTTSEFIR